MSSIKSDSKSIKAMQAELKAMKHRQALFEATEQVAQVGHFEWDIETGCLLSCSEQYARIYEMTVAEVMQAQSNWDKTLKQIHPEDRADFDRTREHIFEEKSLDSRYRIQLEDGQVKHLHEVGIIMDSADGVENTIFGILQDITEQVKHERDLEYRDELARQAESITDIGHFIFDETKGCYLYLSEGYARIYGKSVDEYMSKVANFSDDLADIHDDDRERVEQEYRDYIKTGDECAIEYRIYRADGEVRWMRKLGKAHAMLDGEVLQTIGVVQDITQRVEAEQEIVRARDTLEHQVVERTRELANTINQLQEEIDERKKIAAELDFLANHDALTGLPSLRLCKDRLDRSLAEARRNRQTSAVMFLDLDGFKAINDAYGHEFGDLVLKVTADRIKAEIRETDTVARIGGDEFVIILSSLPQLDIVNRIANNLIDQIGQSIHIEQNQVAVNASIGVALYPEDGTTSEELIRTADKAMYMVKRAGKNNFGFVRPEKLN